MIDPSSPNSNSSQPERKMLVTRKKVIVPTNDVGTPTLESLGAGACSLVEQYPVAFEALRAKADAGSNQADLFRMATEMGVPAKDAAHLAGIVHATTPRSRQHRPTLLAQEEARSRAAGSGLFAAAIVLDVTLAIAAVAAFVLGERNIGIGLAAFSLITLAFARLSKPGR